MMRWLALLVVIAPSAASAGPCAVRPLEPKVLTPAGARLAPGGGIVVAHVASSGELPPGDSATWRVRTGGRVLPPTIRHEIAPGLDLYDTADTAGEVWLEDGSHNVIVRALAADKVAELAAPVVRGVASATSGGRRPSLTVAVDLGAKVPAHAIAIVAFGTDGAARSFGVVQPGETGAVIYASGGCLQQPSGLVITQPGDEIQLAWLADSGKLSKKSAKIKVTARGR